MLGEGEGPQKDRGRGRSEVIIVGRVMDGGWVP